MYMDTNPQQNTSKLNPAYIKSIIHNEQVGFISVMKDCYNV